MPLTLAERIRRLAKRSAPIDKYTLGRWAAAADILQSKRDALAAECRTLTVEAQTQRKLLEQYVKECGGAKALTAEDWGKDIVLLTLQRRRAEIDRLTAVLHEIERLNDMDSAMWRHDIESAVLTAVPSYTDSSTGSSPSTVCVSCGEICPGDYSCDRHGTPVCADCSCPNCVKVTVA